MTRYVIAHYVVGVASALTVEDWRDDIRKAQALSIDGFALNIAFLDPNNDASLSRAFQAAEELGSRFKLYLNFDYLAWGTWEAQAVISKINRFKHSPAYFYYSDRPFVSTFEGTGNVHDWISIKQATGCVFVPDWSSLGPTGAAQHLGKVADGLASWDAWPEGPNSLSTATDESYIQALGGRPYMMPVSPWFYTNLPNYGKNWLWRSDDLWHHRWQQAIQLAQHVQIVQIISWNDYGESHYIGPIRAAGRPAGSEWYVNDKHDHQAWGDLLPQYISAFKAVGPIQQQPHAPSSSDGPDKLTYWYRLNPSLSGSAQGTTGNNPSYQTPYPPHLLAEDKLFLTVSLTAAPAEIFVTIGGDHSPRKFRADHVGISHFSVPFANQTGPVNIKVVREKDGKVCLTAEGPPITTQCVDGMVNWNPVVGRGVAK